MDIVRNLRAHDEEEVSFQVPTIYVREPWSPDSEAVVEWSLPKGGLPDAAVKRHLTRLIEVRAGLSLLADRDANITDEALARLLVERVQAAIEKRARGSKAAQTRGRCEHCARGFEYALVHNGFNESAYAYCDSCGCVAVLSGWFARIPPAAKFRGQGPISPETQEWLQPCQCGGRFLLDAAPRCPHCNSRLSAEAARSWIEANAPGTAKGWRWQGDWSGVYCVVVEGRMAADNWIQQDAARK